VKWLRTKLPLIDHRGNPAELCGTHNLPENAGSKLFGLVHGAGEKRPERVVLSSAFTFGIVAFLQPMLFGSFKGARLSTVIGWMVAAAIAVFLQVMVASMFRSHSYRKAGLACLRAGLCPSCGYDIATHAPEGDGCTVCPECGAAWRLRA
jgi:hypothetical protein